MAFAPTTQLTIHHNASDGPILGLQDILSDAGPYPTYKLLCAVIDSLVVTLAHELRVTARSVLSQAHIILQTQNKLLPQPTAARQQPPLDRDLGIRIVTLELARLNPDINAILPIRGDSISPGTSLSQPTVCVKQHLASPTVLVRPIIWHSMATNNISLVSVAAADKATLMQAAKECLQDRVANKALVFIGGVTHVNFSQGANTNYKLDLHTPEYPIEIIASNTHLTLTEVEPEDCANNGALSIYAVKRCGRDEASVRTGEQGRNTIFRNEDLA
ncbi:hypothetical protein CC78DRAFT_620881 [Lojkania enalia]|uniref:Uncharacterized protein n=1 Tax=Lojkania enalia TaxID=147567 RepID=A0A9P4JZU0_9PLEO|nr:hypothetical protein CC78DRAFT_620881 [Didymosphaeria enalia]